MAGRWNGSPRPTGRRRTDDWGAIALMRCRSGGWGLAPRDPPPDAGGVLVGRRRRRTPLALAEVIARAAGDRTEVVLEPTYGGHWAGGPPEGAGAGVSLAPPVGGGRGGGGLLGA